jgi:hypothetical protein
MRILRLELNFAIESRKSHHPTGGDSTGCTSVIVTCRRADPAGRISVGESTTVIWYRDSSHRDDRNVLSVMLPVLDYDCNYELN